MVKLAWVVLPEATHAGLPYDELLAESLIASWVGLGRWITGAEMPLAEALGTLLKQRVSGAIVMCDERYVGIITERSAARA